MAFDAPLPLRFSDVAAPPSLRTQRLAWLQDEDFRNWVGEEAARVWSGALRDQGLAPPRIDAMTADIQSVVWNGAEPGMLSILLDAPGYQGAVINIHRETNKPVQPVVEKTPRPQVEAADPLPRALRMKEAAPPRRTVHERPIYNAAMRIDSALLSVYKSYTNAMTRDMQALPGFAADAVAVHPKVVASAMAGMTTAAVLAVTTLSGGIAGQPNQTASYQTISLPSAPPISAPLTAAFNDVAPILPRLVLEEAANAPDNYQANLTQEARDTLAGVQNDGLRAVLDGYVSNNYFQHRAHSTDAEDVYLAHWPLRAASAVDDMWSDKGTRTMLKRAGFENPTQIYKSVMVFAQIESRGGTELTNKQNERVLGLFHFEENTYRNILRNEMGIKHVNLDDRKDDTKLTTQALVHLIVDNARILAVKSDGRLRQQDIIRSPTLQYFGHVLGGTLAPDIIKMRDNAAPAHDRQHRHAAEDNRSLYYNILGIARTKDSMLDEFGDRVATATRKVGDKGIDFSLGHTMQPVIAQAPARLPAAHQRALAAHNARGV